MRCFVLALALVAASAFTPTPAFPRTRSVVMSADGESRREMLVKTAGAFGVAFSGAGAAFADGAVSAATIQRARGIYGARILDLKSAVAAGDFGAVDAEKNAFILFNSGVYVKPKDKAAKAAAVGATDKIFAAVAAKDKSGLQSAYAEFMKSADIQDVYDEKTSAYTQGYSTEYDWKARSKKGTIYVR